MYSSPNPGEAIVAEMFRTGLVRKPKYWTPEQLRYLRCAFDAVKTDDRRPFLYSAIGIRAKMSFAVAKEISSQLVQREILLDITGDDRRAFAPFALPMIRNHFGAPIPPSRPIVPVHRTISIPNAAAQTAKKAELERSRKRNEELVESYSRKPEAQQPLNPKTGLTSDEERFLIAGAESLTGVFDVARTGAEIEYSEERTQYVAAHLRKKEFLDSRDDGRLAALTLSGQRILEEMYNSGIPMQPKSWTVLQSRFLQHALEVAGAHNESFLCEAIAPIAQIKIEGVEAICWALAKRRVLTIIGTRFGPHRYAFASEAFRIVAAHFGLTIPAETQTRKAVGRSYAPNGDVGGQLKGADLASAKESAHALVHQLSHSVTPTITEDDWPNANQPDPPEDSTNPLKLLFLSIKSNPVNVLALGVVGLASALAIIVGLVRDIRLAIFGLLLLMIGMGALYVVALVKQHGSKHARWAVPVFIGFVLIALIAGFVVLFTAFAFGVPEHAAKILFDRASS